MADAIGEGAESPQKIKHHLVQLERKGFIRIDRDNGVAERTPSSASRSVGLVSGPGGLFSIPIVGTANCGPATVFAEQNIDGFLRVSSRLVGRKRPDGLFAVRADGSSMNRAMVGGRPIDDGDLVIIDSMSKDADTGDVVLAVIDGKATIKKFINDRENGQVVLAAQSSYDYEPIYLHPDDNFEINGKAVSVVKRPKV
jgi:SOS-response transcriptional repressor LexA